VRRTLLLAVAAAAVVTTASLLARRTRRRDPDRPLAVTVARPVAEVTTELLVDGRVTGPLADVPGHVEVELRPAPGDRGTEIVARLGDRRGGTDPVGPFARVDRRRDLREALRNAKQVLETGEVLLADRPGTTRPTLLNAPLRLATSLGRREGRL
jgi:hypothetical protein